MTTSTEPGDETAAKDVTNSGRAASAPTAGSPVTGAPCELRHTGKRDCPACRQALIEALGTDRS